jgi:RimJ/RimL family protein N-acetyltransferase
MCCFLYVTTKGKLCRYKGIMFDVCQKLMDWASKSFDIHNFYLKVLPNNYKALSLDRRLGFEKINREALYQEN